MDLNSLNLTPERRKRLELDLNDLYEDYTDTMGRLQKEAGNSVSGLVWDGESQELIKQEINRYADAANKLASDYYSSVRDLWAQYGETDMPEYDPPTISADRAVWQMEGGFNNTDFMGLRYKDVIPDENGIVHNRAGRSIDDLWPTFADEEQAFGYVQNLIQTVGRLTMQRAVANDPTKPRWARVPRGAKTCAFCLMLASRGFAYLSEDTAGRQMQYHADCDCDIVPSWGKQALVGYDVDALEAQYEQMRELAQKEYAGDILRAYRGTPGLCTDSVVPEALKKTPGRPPKFDADHPFRTFLGSGNLRDAVVGTNPMFDEGPEYRNNCQRCIVAYEMRRRGYAVTAMPRPMNPETGRPSPDLDTNRWGTAFKSTQLQCGKGNGESEAVNYLNEWGEGSRAIIYVEWETGGQAHVFVAENLKNGIVFVDPQSGDMNVRRYFKSAKAGKTSIIRIDNAEPTELVLKYCKEE